MDCVAVQVSASSVVVLGGSWVGVAGENLRVPQGDAGVQGVGDRGVTQRVGADMSRDLRDLRDSQDHPGGPTSSRWASGPTRKISSDMSSVCSTGSVIPWTSPKVSRMPWLACSMSPAPMMTWRMIGKRGSSVT